MRKFEEKLDEEKRKRMQLKSLLCVVSILILFFASVKSLHITQGESQPTEYVQLQNATDLSENPADKNTDEKEAEAENSEQDNCYMESVNPEYIRVLIQNSNYGGNYHDSVILSCDTGFKIVYGKGVEVSISGNDISGMENNSVSVNDVSDKGDLASGFLSVSERDVSGADISGNNYNNTIIQEAYSAGELVSVTKESIYFSQQDGENLIYIIPDATSGKISLHSVERSHGTPSYRGILEIRLMEEGLVVINQLLLEEYLYAVVPSEMPANYPLEALKAQAICARTYAYSHMLHPGLPQFGAHVDDSTGFQVYNNITEQASTTIAVNETAGQLLYTTEGLASTYYYSTSCGFGSDEHVWKSEYDVELAHVTAKQIGTSQGVYTPENMCQEEVFRQYIQNPQQEDFEKDEPWYRWSYEVQEIDSDALLSILQKRYDANPQLVLMWDGEQFISCKPEKIGDIRNIEIVKRNAGGVADELLIEGSEASYKVVSELFIRYVLCDGKTQVLRQDGSLVDMSSLLPSAFFAIDIKKDGKQVTGYTLTGGGFGHGAGMSQNGAKNMALNGYTATQILENFFTDTEVRKVGEDGT